MQTQQKTRSKSKSSSNQKFFCPIESKSKLKIWFKDGNIRTFYSNLKKDKISMETGVLALEKYINSREVYDKYKTAIIYVNRFNARHIVKYIDGAKQWKK